jgi:hypothetical protein
VAAEPENSVSQTFLDMARRLAFPAG